jgi:hypothetical protein
MQPDERLNALFAPKTIDQASYKVYAGASAYAVWEWRNEMLEKLLALKNKLGIK